LRESERARERESERARERESERARERESEREREREREREALFLEGVCVSFSLCVFLSLFLSFFPRQKGRGGVRIDTGEGGFMGFSL
jgi:hypothetical protein